MTENTKVRFENTEKKTTDFCAKSAKFLEAIESLEYLDKIKDSLQKKGEKQLTRLILEETIAYRWNKIQGVLFQVQQLMPLIENRVIGKVPRVKRMIAQYNLFFKTNIIRPCLVARFLEEFLNSEESKENLQFLKWLFSSPERCQSAFREVKKKNATS